MKKVALKICGMNQNISEVALLQPEYMGFIFYDKSPRVFKGGIPTLPKHIKKVGVFVNASTDDISEKIKTHKLDVIQLHGEESPAFCRTLKTLLDNDKSSIEIWKVFGIKDSFDFQELTPYENTVDKFLFDTKGKARGGNGYVFDWKALEGYPSKKPFILSGGIGLDEIVKLKSILNSNLPIHAIDVNSKFESEPGFKITKDLKKLMQQLQSEQ